MGTVRYTVIDGEVVSEKRGGVRRQYVPDPLGSTVVLMDSTQTKTDTFDYWPYGEEASRTGTTATPFRYVGTVGYYRDSAARQYVRARYLDSRLGRWATEDPIGFEGGWNLFSYVADSPATLIDPFGLQVDSVTSNPGIAAQCGVSTSESVGVIGRIFAPPRLPPFPWPQIRIGIKIGPIALPFPRPRPEPCSVSHAEPVVIPPALGSLGGPIQMKDCYYVCPGRPSWYPPVKKRVRDGEGCPPVCTDSVLHLEVPCAVPGR
jgi:RHS repeat-associated protein